MCPLPHSNGSISIPFKERKIRLSFRDYRYIQKFHSFFYDNFVPYMGFDEKNISIYLCMLELLCESCACVYCPLYRILYADKCLSFISMIATFNVILTV